ncbi:Putative cytosolic protein (plasmid) [Borrelia crocidurae DOU]|uniref:Putative cytosolic protein n=1 Tax=Borrelia crocidurae DOU TaxID=1293575 RepID=W5SM31_9SPIR|nr:DUF226 domain-containing protein [Borrelia crocidurae]AHH07905.1 Putative cytosolic protein [Borrelia crocidurae DOU]
MQSILERLKEKKIEIKKKEGKTIFVKMENISNRILYHTKIMMDLYTFGINKRQTHKFFIAFRKLFNREKIEWFSLFSVKDDDKFLGIFYGSRKPIKNVVRKYEENGVKKASSFSRICYIEFRFKRGSVFCYLRGLSYLFRKDKVDTKYYKALTEKLSTLEVQVYKFYGQNLPTGGFISKWIARKQR